MPLTGELGFTGDIVLDTDSLGTATEFIFPGGDINALASNGDFSGVSNGDSGSIDTFMFSPFAPSGFSFDSFDFTFTSVTVNVVSPTSVQISGTGVVTRDGFDDTSFTYNGSATSNGPVGVFSVVLVASGTGSRVPGMLAGGAVDELLLQ